MGIEIGDRENHMVVDQPFENELPGIDFDDDGDSIRQNEADDEADRRAHRKAFGVAVQKMKRDDLCRRLLNMRRHIGILNAFDKADLLKLLFEAEKEIRK